MRSIRVSLLSWLVALQLLAVVLLSLSTYAHTRARMNELHDDELRQVALTTMLHHGSRATDVVSPRPGRTPPLAVKMVTQIWTADGRHLRGFGSDPGIALTPEEGFSLWSRGDARWRVYTLRDESGFFFQVAQNLQDRKEIAIEIALKMLIPSVAIVLLIALALTFALNRNLRPLAAASREIGRRSASSLEAVAANDLPAEIHPLVASINALMQRLEHALAMQRQFTADAAHELRTPLTALRLQLRLLGNAADENEREAALTDMRAGLERATRQVEQLLALSRLDPDATRRRNEAVDLCALVRSVVGEFSLRAHGIGIDLGASIPDASLLVRGDPDQLRILLNNLVDNALRYTPADGHVDVRLAAVTGTGLIVLEVLDDGPGIAPIERPRVFDRFYRAASSQSEQETIAGTGLGLAIVKSIADQQGARISLDDGLPDGRGPGLSVRVEFPAEPSD